MSRVSAWPRPAAVLLDFGGVLVESRRRPAGVAELAIQVSAMLATRNVPAPDVSTIDSDIAAGLDAWRRWKTARSRESAPRELSHQEFWARFVAASWSEPARRVVVPMAYLGANVWHLPVYLVYLCAMSEEATKWILGINRYFSRKWIHNLAAHVDGV